MSQSAPSARNIRQSSRPAPLAADLRVAVMRLSRRLRGENISGLPGGQYSVLAALSHGGPSTPGALAAHENVQPPSMTRTVAALEAAGLVERTISQTDRRQCVISLTQAGRDVVAHTRQRRDAWLATQLAALSANDRAVITQATVILGEMIRH